MHKGNLLNRNLLSVSLEPGIEGINATKNHNELSLTVPYFTNQRTLTIKNYLPLLGQNTISYQLISSDKYHFNLSSNNQRKVTLNITLKSLIIVSITLLLIILALSRQKQNSSLTILNTYLILLSTLLFTHSSLPLTTLSLTMLSLYHSSLNKIFKISILIFITLPLALLTNHPATNLNLQNYTKNKNVLSANNIIHNPQDVPKAIALLAASYTKSEVLDISFCHPAMHQLGTLAYLKLKNPKSALLYATTTCEYGYLHGVEDGISLMSTNVSRSKNLYLSGCQEIFKGTNINTFQECIHGSGHAFYELTAGDIPSSLAACTIWGTNTLLCDNAVFMSYGDYNYFTHQNQYPANICLTQKDSTALSACLAITPRYVLSKFATLNSSLPNLKTFCLRYQDDNFANCTMGIGDALAYLISYNFKNESTTLAVSSCTLAGKLSLNCYTGYLRSIAYYRALAKLPSNAALYCSLPYLNKQTCFTTYAENYQRLAH